MMTINDRIAQYLSSNPGKTSAQIAAAIGADKTAISNALNNYLAGKFLQDMEYRWWPMDQAPTIKMNNLQDEKFANTPLSNLARYYLACLGQDELSDVSVLARDRYNTPDYAGLTALPDSAIEPVLQQNAVAALVNRVRSDRNPQILYLGYPVSVQQDISKRGEPYFKLEPLLLLPIQFDQANNRGIASLSNEFPMINTAVLKRYSNADGNSIMGELLALEDELGYDNVSQVPSLQELAQRLHSIRPEWPWFESCKPDALITEPALNVLDRPGIYNRAVILSAERKPYTQGLETELRELAKKGIEAYRDTALGKLVHNRLNSDSLPVGQADDMPLIEVLPMNNEQRMAVHSALTKPLTIITGPPGTGKSQVVTNLLINAAWQNKKVLFASKNNKAVDVVETRVNNLGSRPILMRMGMTQYQLKLREYLQNLLSATASEEEKLAYRDALAAYHKNMKDLTALEKMQIDVIDTRNQVDELEQKVERLRNELSADLFSAIKTIDVETLQTHADDFVLALNAADKSAHNILIKAAWQLVGKQRYKRLKDTIAHIRDDLKLLGIAVPHSEPDEFVYKEWRGVGTKLDALLPSVREVKTYFDGLNKLKRMSSLEEINLKTRQLRQVLSKNSEELWESWLRVRPSELSSNERQLLSQYASVLKIITDNNSQSADRATWRRYYELTASVSGFLSCWAVTSLSARGKLPFTAGFFDLVIFDEASQCDIASALPLLFRAKSAVVIGDPMQLSHISSIQKNVDQQLLERFELGEGYLQWAYSWNSLFDMAFSYVAAKDIVNLRDHHRSHADIINFSNEYFYEGRLRVATHYDRLNKPDQESRSLRWINVKGKTTRPESGSAINKSEADKIVLELRKLVLGQGYRGTIGVVTPFRAQANYINELCNRDAELINLLNELDFQCNTVHRFQGDERDVMIFSPVISEGAHASAIGFLNNSQNLFNVAITRARAMLLVVGDQVAAASSGVEYLARFAQYVAELEQAQQEGDVNYRASDIGPEYPTHVDRSKVSDWEVILYNALYEAGIKTIPQYPVEQYSLDLAVIDGDRRLDIEVDGERYHRNWTGELTRRDQIRNQRLFELGWDVKRFWVYQIRDDIDGCIQSIQQWIDMGKK